MIVCAWCDKVLDDSPEKIKEFDGKISHSICKSCRDEAFRNFTGNAKEKNENETGIQGVVE